jgi:hypothetical protein
VIRKGSNVPAIIEESPERRVIAEPSETLGQGSDNNASPVRALRVTDRKDLRYVGMRIAFGLTLTGLSSAFGISQDSAALHPGLFCRALSGLQPLASLGEAS